MFVKICELVNCTILLFVIDEILVAVPALPETEVTLEFNNVESEVKLVPPRATDKIPVVPATIGNPVASANANAGVVSDAPNATVTPPKFTLSDANFAIGISSSETVIFEKSV